MQFHDVAGGIAEPDLAHLGAVVVLAPSDMRDSGSVEFGDRGVEVVDAEAHVVGARVDAGERFAADEVQLHIAHGEPCAGDARDLWTPGRVEAEHVAIEGGRVVNATADVDARMQDPSDTHGRVLPSTAMTVTALANLAFKVEDMDAAVAFYERAGAEVRDRIEWNGGERADVSLGALPITLFTRAIYEDTVPVDEGFLHPALFTDDLERELVGHDVVWGPEVVSGPFGTRRIAFVAAPGGMRLEFMEQLED